MSKINKLIDKMLSSPKGFTWIEMIKVLQYFGFSLFNKGKTGGSRRVFVRQSDKAIIQLHEPHPQKVLKPYVI